MFFLNINIHKPECFCDTNYGSAGAMFSNFITIRQNYYNLFLRFCNARTTYPPTQCDLIPWECIFGDNLEWRCEMNLFEIILLFAEKLEPLRSWSFDWLWSSGALTLKLGPASGDWGQTELAGPVRAPVKGKNFL